MKGATDARFEAPHGSAPSLSAHSSPCPAAAFAQQAPAKVTFSKDVAPIFQAKCQSCHEPGSIAPMSLVTYQDARPWARSIKQRVEARQMPPWHIDRSVGVQKFKNDMSLTDEQVETIVGVGGRRRPRGQPGRLQGQAGGDRACSGRPSATATGRPTRRQGARVHDARRPPGRVVAPGRRHPGSPSRAGCGWSRSARPTSQGRKILHHSIAYHVLNPENADAVNTGIGRSAASHSGADGRPSGCRSASTVARS